MSHHVTHQTTPIKNYVTLTYNPPPDAADCIPNTESEVKILPNNIHKQVNIKYCCHSVIR